MTAKITATGRLIAEMWERRHESLITLHRVCSPQEAIDTWFYCLAGGRFADLEDVRPTEAVVIEQVGNHEGVTLTAEEKARKLALMEKLGIAPAPPKPRVVVEYARGIAGGFHGCLVTAKVNRHFIRRGSRAPGEGEGEVIQIGTPLSQVTIDDDVLRMAFPNRYEF